MTVTLILGVGVVVGLALGWLATRVVLGRPRQSDHDHALAEYGAAWSIEAGETEGAAPRALVEVPLRHLGIDAHQRHVWANAHPVPHARSVTLLEPVTDTIVVIVGDDR